MESYDDESLIELFAADSLSLTSSSVSMLDYVCFAKKLRCLFVYKSVMRLKCYKTYVTSVKTLPQPDRSHVPDAQGTIQRLSETHRPFNYL